MSFWPRKKDVFPPLLLLLSALTSGCSAIIHYGKNRALDLSDCFKISVGYGIGLTLDIKVTDWFAPGLGYMAYSNAFGWDSRQRFGNWKEWVVINTPKGIFEANFGGDDYNSIIFEGSEESHLVRLALSSVFLANERWVKVDNSDKVEIELYSLFNFWGIPRFIRIIDPRKFFLKEGDVAKIINKRFWRKGFIECGATIGVFHGRIGLNLFEGIDFLFGFAGIDMAEDDK